MSNNLHFTASTNVKNLLGKDLVTDQITAVFELVKNSYDADATEVLIEFSNLKNGSGSLTITDNGSGMDLNDIKNKWMVIGTESKKHKTESEKYKRPLNGEKGIGRFSVDRLGKELELYSIKENNNKKIFAIFDWTKFENEFNELNKILIPYQETSIIKGSKQGVTLKINKLRDIWDKKSINKLIANLRQLKTPFKINDNFTMKVNVPEYGIHEYDIVPYDLADISNLWISAEIPIEDSSKIKITVVRDGIEYNEEYKNTYNFGPVNSRIYFFDKAAKLRFKHRYGIRVKDFGNIRLYRDDFRVHPYGESYNDWLDLDIRKAQGFNRFFGSRDLVGYVQIYKNLNKGIDVPTNRQGIIESVHSQQLRDFIRVNPVKILEKYFFKKPKNESFQKSKKDIDTAVVELKRVANDVQKTSPSTARIIRQLTEVVEKGQEEQAQFVKNQEELLEVYKRVASKEVLLHQIIHQVLIRVKSIIAVTYTADETLNEFHKVQANNDFISEIRGYFSNIKNTASKSESFLLKVRDHLIRKKEKVRVSLKDFIEEVLEAHSGEFRMNNIKVIIESGDDEYLSIDSEDLYTIIENFISNSVKSLVKANDIDRFIYIKVLHNSNDLVLIFKDNGVGIPEHMRDRIFDPFFSTTDGFGMGLSIVDEIVKQYNGQLNLAINYESGAEFQIKFRR